jgi:hypothetical protein
VFRLKKAIYGINQAACRWDTRISTWMEENGYPAVNSEKTILMKRTGDGLFVDDIKSVPTKKALLDEFIAKYSKEFKNQDHWRTADSQIPGLIRRSGQSLHLPPPGSVHTGDNRGIPEVHQQGFQTEDDTNAARQRLGT